MCMLSVILIDFEKINEVFICCCGVVVVSLWCRCSAVIDVALKRHRTGLVYNTGLEHKLCSFICSGIIGLNSFGACRARSDQGCIISTRL